MMKPEDKKKIMHRRWTITGIIVIILITWLQLWSLVWLIFYGFLMIMGVMWFIEWITGMDLDTPVKRQHDNQPSDIEETMWDIETFHELHHHDDKNE